MMLQRFYPLPFSFSGDGSVWTWGWGKISSVLFFTSLPLPDERDARLISYDKDIFEVKFSLDLLLNLNSPLSSFYRHSKEGPSPLIEIPLAKGQLSLFNVGFASYMLYNS